MKGVIYMYEIRIKNICINSDYTTQFVKLVMAKDLKVSEKKGNTKVTVLKDVSFGPVCRLAKGYDG